MLKMELTSFYIKLKGVLYVILDIQAWGNCMLCQHQLVI